MITPQYAVAAANMATLKLLGSVQQIGRRNPNSCATVIPFNAGHGNDKIQIWANVWYKGYREAFRGHGLRHGKRT